MRGGGRCRGGTCRVRGASPYEALDGGSPLVHEGHGSNLAYERRLEFLAHKAPALAGFLALGTRQPVRYIEDRGDRLATSDHHGCARYYDVALALDRDGVLLGLDVDVVHDVLADFGDARVTELPIRSWWIVEMIENGR